MTVDTGTRDDEALRMAMVDRLVTDHSATGRQLRPDVEAAMRTVPRHLYTPGVPLTEAYENRAVVTKRRGSQDISSVSAPFVISEMLCQAGDALAGWEGRHVLEIGSGGYNASLLRELVGDAGSVTTVDIDPEVTDRAIACLAAAGYDDVTVVTADAEHPVGPRTSYDVIMVTAGAWDIPSAWREQLAESGGVLVVPLRTFGMTRSWALRRDGDQLSSVSQRMCGFVPVQGDGAYDVQYLDIADGVHIRLDEGQAIDAAVFAGLLSEPRTQVWTGVSLPPRTALPDLDLWLAVRLSREVEHFVVLSAQESAVEADVVAPSWRFGTPATVHEGTFAYRSALRWTDRTFDLGAHAHGAAADAEAHRMVEHMRAWLDAGQPSPTLHLLPRQTPAGTLPAGTALDRRHSRLVLGFNP